MQRDGPPRPSVCQMTGRIKCKDEKKKKKKNQKKKKKKKKKKKISIVQVFRFEFLNFRISQIWNFHPC